jgi:hypothetical protein
LAESDAPEVTVVPQALALIAAIVSLLALLPLLTLAALTLSLAFRARPLSDPDEADDRPVRRVK